MAPLILLCVAAITFRGFGAVGVEAFASWQNCARYALSLMFLFTASAHFTKMKHDLINMVPTTLPYASQLVFFTGICEIAGAVALLIPPLQKLAAISLILLLFAMLPANIYAAKHQIPLRGKAPTPLWLRLPMQFFFIGLIWWST